MRVLDIVFFDSHERFGPFGFEAVARPVAFGDPGSSIRSPNRQMQRNGRFPDFSLSTDDFEQVIWL